MDIRMIISDLDGTLLSQERGIPDDNLRALRSCMARGIHLVLASGRSFESVRQLSLSYGLAGPIASANGARVDLSAEGPLLYKRTFPLDVSTAVFNIMKRSGIFFTCYGQNALYQNNIAAADRWLRNPTKRESQMEMQMHRSEIWVADESRTIKEGLTDPYKFVAFSSDIPRLHALRDELASSGLPLNICSSWADNLEVMIGGAGKDSAIDALCEHFGLTRSQVIAFGDNLNDIDMLRAAGLGVAMGNALPEVKAAADIIAPSNNESGVARILEQYILSDEGR